MKTVAFGATDRGRTREHNEDAYSIDDSLGLYVVCDGLGGHAAGEVASRTAVEAAVRHVAENRRLLEEARVSLGGRFAVQVLVDDAIQEASRRLHELARSDSRFAGMATTMTLVLAWNGRAVLGHVGDGRLYVRRGGEVQLLTIDHTIGEELSRRGTMSPDEIARNELAGVLTRTVGGQPSVLVDTLSLDMLPGDTYLLCTDGLYRYLDDGELSELLGRGDVSEAPDMLVRLANDRGGGDNITAVVFRPAGEAHEDEGTAEALRAGRRLEALSTVPLLRDLSLPRLAGVLQVMETRRYRAGEDLLRAGAALEGLYVLVDGRVEGPGGTAPRAFGERSLTGRRPAAAGIRASEDSEVLVLARDAFARLVRRHPRLGCRLLWNLVTLPETQGKG